MSKKLSYYIDLISELCGFDGSGGNAVFGWFMIAIAAAIVIWAFYFWITRSIWPGETNADHIKRQILLDDETTNAN